MALRLSCLLCITVTYALVNGMPLNVQARDRMRGSKDKVGSFHENICDITDRDSKVHCYCENTREPRNATKAECWVFDGDISRDDSIWQSFASQPTLQSLSFNVRVDRALNYMPTKALIYLPKLRSINVKYGNIAEVTSYALANLTNLKEAILSHNQIQLLRSHAFAHLSNITIINLEDNILKEIGTKCFYDLPKLQKLVFTKNNITSIRDGAFQYAFNLLELDLNKNNIFQLNRHTFDGLANLRSLDLKRNHIQNLTEYTFVELWNLQELLLGKNDLKFVSERAFDGLSQLRKLSLDENKLITLPPRLFEGVRGLSSLDLRSNELYSLTVDNLKPILDNLKLQNSSLLIEDNNFICDCRLKWIYTFKNETKSQSTKNSLNNVTCKFDSIIVSLAYNKIPEEIKVNHQVIHDNATESLDKKIISDKLTTIEGDKKSHSELVSKKTKKKLLKIPPDLLQRYKEIVSTTENFVYVEKIVTPVQNINPKNMIFGLPTDKSAKTSISKLSLTCISFAFFFT